MESKLTGIKFPPKKKIKTSYQDFSNSKTKIGLQTILNLNFVLTKYSQSS